MKHLVLLAALSLAAAPAFAQLTRPPGERPAPSAPALSPVTGAERDALLTRASRALDSVRMVESKFRQVSPRGDITTGTLTMARPGRLRIEYDAPSPLLVVSDGTKVTIADRAFKSFDSVPLRATPLFFVLKSNVDLTRDAAVTDVSRQGDSVFITARDRKREIDGQITLELRGPTLQLAGWRIIDGQSGATSISLQDAKAISRVDPKLFRFDAPDPIQRRRG
jgi:outer membrane lipoprotein-sorting protein